MFGGDRMYKAELECGELIAKSRVLPLDHSVLDDLETECWELFMKYCEEFNIRIRVDNSYIDFDIAKAISGKILEYFEKMGFLFTGLNENY